MESKDWFWTVAPWLFRSLFLLILPSPTFFFLSIKTRGKEKVRKKKSAFHIMISFN